ncbi:capsular exopolysaccharide synthesis family protein [Rhodoligotrophos appendicifer]|uniref:GumC family protein n=1 Tax=Rhodoligotrophos appendicifer TaxID=987056 RepID=UPI001184AAEE|nr:polysaccharide biosynthesis tyrosine autokinase [Rhodoligotrophos appendicifer]
MLDRQGRYPGAAIGAPVQALPAHHEGPRELDVYYGREDTDKEDRLTPFKIFLYVVRYRWLLLVLCLAGVVCGVAVTMMQTPLYRATARLEVLVPSAKVFQDMEAISEASDVRAFLTAREKLTSRALAQRVAYALQLSEKPQFLFPKAEFSVANIFYRAFGMGQPPTLEDLSSEQRENMAVGRVLHGVTASLVQGTSLISITFQDQSPLFAKDVANQIAQSFIDQRVDRTSETSSLARQFIEEQVLQVKDKLQKSEQALVEYARTAGITITGKELSLIGANIETLNSALATAIQERLDTGRLVAQIDAGRGGSLPQVLESEGLTKLRGTIADLSGQYQQKLGLLKPNFPEMKQLLAQIAELRRLVDDGIMAILDSIKLKYQEAINKESDLRAKLIDMEKQNIEFNDKSIKYTILRREVDSNRSQYENLISKMNEATIGSELKSQNAAIVDLAIAPSAPFSPSMLKNVAVGLALFMSLGALIIYVLEMMDNTFTRPEQVEKELGLTVLGILPKSDDRDLGANVTDQKSALSEAYRSLRTSLQFSGADGVPNTLLVTSAEPSEGKSTTSFKLAQDFAILGANVLVIDADMRKPSLHRLFGLSNILGLSNMLTNTVRREDVPGIFRSTKFDNVTVLTSGTIPPNPADLLSSPRMASLLDSLTGSFDLIIIDAPPVVGLSDAPILSRLVEGTLMVISTNQVTRKSAKAALKRLRAAGASVAGAAMSKFSISKFDYDYKHLNYQYYAYGAERAQLDDRGEHGSDRRVRGKHSALSDLVRRLRLYRDGVVDRAQSKS